ncbi:MAG: hypothetical protein UHW86_08125 [Spirochaetota bacterium]|jgi:hypothetical protein|nr:hypothetical protein [Spirochaetota bacterium]
MKKTILFTLFALLTISVYSQPVSVNIEFTNPKIFKANEDIYIDVKLSNKETTPYSSLMAQDKRYSFDFELISLQNKQQQHSADYSNFFNRVQPVFHSVVRLEENEGYTYRVLLNDYFDMNITGQYILKCIYYPEMKLSNSPDNTAVKSNSITLNIRPADSDEQFIQEYIVAEKEKSLIMEKKSPDEVVDYMLNARINGEWEKFFLYIDLDKMICADITFGKRYKKADSDMQQEILKEYKEYLKKDKINEISYLPCKFEIIKTEYTAGSGKVDAFVMFKEHDYVDKKYYTYFLKKQDDKWKITNYTVSNTSGN